MSSFWLKVCADLSVHKARTVLAIVSIAMGMFAVGTLLGLVDMQLTAMDTAHRQSQPSHINLILRNAVSAETVQALRGLAGIEAVDVLSQLTVHYKSAGTSAWKLGTVVWRPDYNRQTYDVLTLDSGVWPHDAAIGIERFSAQYAHLRIGDTLSFATVEGTRELPIVGTLRHPFVKPPPFGGQLHFFVDDSMAKAFGLATDGYRQLLVRIREPYDPERVRTLASELRAELARHGVNVSATLLQDPDKHWGRAFFAGINLVLEVMAWAILGLGCVLVVNTIAAHLTQQVNQIGIMKALGARRGYIARLYASEVLILALLALVIALPAAAFVAWWGTRWLLDLFNIDFTPFRYSRSAIAWTATGGLLAPLLATVWPIAKAARMPVREAIARHGLGSDFGSSWIDRGIERFGARYLPTLHAVALGNLFRRKGRLLWTQLVLIIAGVVFMVTMSLIGSVNLTLDNELARSRYDVRLGLVTDQAVDQIKDWIQEVGSTQALEFWDRTAVELARDGRTLKQIGSLGAQLIALPVTTTMYQPLIVEGRWFTADDAGTRSLVISADTAEMNGINVGDGIDLQLRGAEVGQWRIVGTYRWLAGSNYTVEPVYAPRDTVQQITGQSTNASLVLIKADLGSLVAEADYLDRLRQQLEGRHVALDVYSTTGKREQRQFARNQFRPVTSMLLGLAALVAAVGAIGMSGTLALGVLQRVREIGVLRSVGARSTTIYSLYLFEGLFHALLAWACSVPLAYLLAPPLAKALGLTMLKIQLEFAFDHEAVFIWLGIVMVIAVLASLWPARSAVRVPVRASLDD
jgi:putative ABC transport system permease protein